MMWMSYAKAIYKNITGPPKEGETVLYKLPGGKNTGSCKARVEKIINSRRYRVRYEVPKSVREHFIDGTTSAIARIEDLSFFCPTVIYENEEEQNEP